MEALAGAHDAAVQMIDNSIVRVHQHTACVARSERQSMGRSPGGRPARFMQWSIPKACLSGWELQPVKRTTIGSPSNSCLA